MESSQNHFLSKGENPMIDQSRVTQLPLFPETLLPPKTSTKPPSLHTYWLHAYAWPPGVSDSLTILRCLELFGPLDWDGVPERNLQRNWGQVSIPYTALIAAELIKLNESLPSTQKLKRFLLEHPGFIWLLGFPLVPAPNQPLGFNAQASLPTQRHLNRLFRQLPNAPLEWNPKKSDKHPLTMSSKTTCSPGFDIILHNGPTTI
jgi:hypothetical protein